MTGEFGEVLVMDWGLARVLGGPDFARESALDTGTQDQRVTLGGQMLGSPPYMSPEQGRGQNDQIDARTDVYGLGALLYEILSLRPAVEGESRREILDKGLAGRIERPTEVSRAPWQIPRDIEAVVTKAMSLSPQDRYATANQLLADVQAFVAGRALAAAKYRPWELLSKWTRRNKAAVIGGLATALALLVGLVGVVWVLARARADRIEERERTRAQEFARRPGEAQESHREGAAREFKV